MKTINYPGRQGVTCLQVLCELVAKTFEMATEMECEI